MTFDFPQTGLTVFGTDFSLFCATELLNNYSLLFFILTGIFGLLTIVLLIFLSRQPQSPKQLSFKVPLTPWIPILSVTINTYLMISLPVETWWRFIIWMAIGFLIYFGYGIVESTGYMSEEERAAYLDSKHSNSECYSPQIAVINYNSNSSPISHPQESTLETID